MQNCESTPGQLTNHGPAGIKGMMDHEGFKKAPPAVPTHFRKQRLELISYYIRRV